MPVNLDDIKKQLDNGFSPITDDVRRMCMEISWLRTERERLEREANQAREAAKELKGRIDSINVWLSNQAKKLEGF